MQNYLLHIPLVFNLKGSDIAQYKHPFINTKPSAICYKFSQIDYSNIFYSPERCLTFGPFVTRKDSVTRSIIETSIRLCPDDLLQLIDIIHTLQTQSTLSIQLQLCAVRLKSFNYTLVNLKLKKNINQCLLSIKKFEVERQKNSL